MTRLFSSMPDESVFSEMELLVKSIEVELHARSAGIRAYVILIVPRVYIRFALSCLGSFQLDLKTLPFSNSRKGRCRHNDARAPRKWAYRMLVDPNSGVSANVDETALLLS